MKIRTKLLLTAATSIGTAVIVGMALFLSFQNLNKEQDESVLVQTLLKEEVELRAATFEYLIHHEQRMYSQWISKYESIATKLQDLRPDSNAEKTLVENVRQNHKGIRAVFDLLIASSRKIRIDDSSNTGGTRSTSSAQEMEAVLGGQLLLRSHAVVSDLFQMAAWSRLGMVRAQKRAALVVVLAIILLVAGITVVSGTIMKSLVKPIAELKRGTEIVGSGNLNFRIGTAREDEIGELSRSFDIMAEKLKAVTFSLDVSEEALGDTLRRLELQIRHMPLACISLDTGFRVLEWNPAAERIFGWSAQEMLGKHPYKLIVPPETRPHVEGLWAKLPEGDESSYSVSANIRKDGKKIICEWFNAPLRNTMGEIVGALFMVHDITEKTRLEKQLQTAQRMESVGTLAGGIAHDFNNALTGILGFSELLRLRVTGDERALSDLDEIKRCAERATTLTRQLLTFARRQIIDPVNLNLNDVVANLMKLISKVSGEQIDIKTFLARDLPTIRADQGQMEQVLMNLCLNARDAMPGGGQLLVETEEVVLDEEYVALNPYMKVGWYALLKVSDTGMGMDEKTRERVFEPFFTTKGPDRGTGLGLAVVYGIVKQHNGFIHLYSEPGKGTSFKVYFPAVDAPPDIVPQVVQEPVRGGTETILIAEDEEAVRGLAERTLTALGYTVLAARDGEEAVRIFERRRTEIALAVLDVVMPRKGGKEAFEVMHKENPELKVILTSGYSVNAVHESFVLIAGTPFLPKPFGPTSLARKVREVLDSPEDRSR